MPQKARRYGHIPGVDVGTLFGSREEASQAGVHGEIRKGIHGDAETGAFSICLNGGYKDDDDFGDKIIYVGSGGRHPTTGRQFGDQSFDDPGNTSLCISFVTEKPVRVLRGEDEYNEYAPKSGYRYDGLFVVDKYYAKKGMAGHEMCFFELSKMAEQGEVPKT